MIRATVRFLPVVLPLSIAACIHPPGDYPSLALRDAERVSGEATPVAGAQQPPAPTLPSPDAKLATRLEGLVSAAQEADRQFKAEQGAAETAVARAAGAAAASDPWASAQIALARLESSRSPALAALAELDGLYTDARDAAPVAVSPDAEAIANARAQVSELVEREDGVIAGLSARLKS